VPEWRDSWLPTLAAVPAVFVASAAFSTLGDGAATRAGTVVVFAAFAFLGFRLLQKESRGVLSADFGPRSA
jgi:hypothetical protein